MPMSAACCPSIWKDTCVPLRGAMADSLQLRAAVRPLKEDVVGNVGQVLWVLLGSISIPAVDRLRQCRQSRARTGGSTRNRACAAHGAGGPTGTPGARADGGEPVAQPDRRADRRRARLRRPAGPAGVPAGELAATERDHDRSASAWLCRGDLGPFGIALRARADPASRRAAVVDLTGTLRGGGRSASAGKNQHRSQNALVVVQVALALVMLVSSGLMIRTFQNLRSVEPGFTDPATVQTVRLSMPASIEAEARLVGTQRASSRAVGGDPRCHVGRLRDFAADGEAGRGQLHCRRGGRDVRKRASSRPRGESWGSHPDCFGLSVRRYSPGVTSIGRSSTSSGTWPWCPRASPARHGIPSRVP